MLFYLNLIMTKNNIYLSILIAALFSFALSKDIQLINFNIHGFNFKSTKNKISEILNNVSSYDIIFFQENWSFQNKIQNTLKDYFLISSIKKSRIKQGSGLMIAIKKGYSIIDFEEVYFKECNGIIFNANDCLASKGFIYARIKVENIYFDIYNTHLDAGNSKKDRIVRSNQLSMLKEYIYNKSYGENIIICGDLNIDYLGQDSNLIDNLSRDLELEFIRWDEKYFLDYKIDYIFYSKSFNSLKINTPDTLFYLSDHPPMSAHLKIIE